MEIWINPACSKCRSALTLLDAEGAEYTVRRYLEDVPSEAEIREVLGRLGLEPWDITRTSDPLAEETGPGVPPDEVWGRDLPREETEEARGRWISRLAAHPELIQRPIITAEDGTAVVARSEEAVREALSR
ncbi:ArsC/Spx/MgsR family protein [Streptomyces sp. H34-S4]|uniref:ArsC/Spx/MgsR family protein n=1 Tax=Streptomyces sp. H34-S4 TaxID=2996463 RepID=UPI0022700278|nr:ArsC/Spx/MgsR family protein [Streptomyces sp. H34-S4]MCY0939474.1 arsenate reductase family protein [Streptomyces sp. H34-S4]